MVVGLYLSLIVFCVKQSHINEIFKVNNYYNTILHIFTFMVNNYFSCQLCTIVANDGVRKLSELLCTIIR